MARLAGEVSSRSLPTLQSLLVAIVYSTVVVVLGCVSVCCSQQCPTGCDCREASLYCNARHLRDFPAADKLPAGLTFATFAQNNISTLEQAVFIQQVEIIEL
eukprot:scpid92165/ scgid10426/ 